MPSYAPLAVPYVPFQQSNSAKYGSREALSQRDPVSSVKPAFPLEKKWGRDCKTPLTELQALGFVILELGLYLDTHPDDAEAFSLFQKYVALGGAPVTLIWKAMAHSSKKEAAKDERYTWLDGRWPWERQEVQE